MAGVTKYLIVFFVGIAVFVAITSNTDRIYGLRSFVVLTGSMEPAIPQGSIIFTKKINDYQKGDIVAFKQGNITVTHRIVKTDKNNALITKGDANDTTDAKPLLQKEVYGRVILFLPYIGQLVLLLKTVPGFIVLIIVPSVILIGWEVRNIVAEIKKDAVKNSPQSLI